MCVMFCLYVCNTKSLGDDGMNWSVEIFMHSLRFVAVHPES